MQGIVIERVSPQTFVPPTPNPLAAATILNFDLSYIIIAGTIVGLAAAVFSMFVWFRMLDRPGFWAPNKDETGLLDMDAAVVHRVDLPSPWAAVIPICLPVLAILIGSFWPVLTGSDAPVVIQFISENHSNPSGPVGCLCHIAEKNGMERTQ